MERAGACTCAPYFEESPGPDVKEGEDADAEEEPEKAADVAQEVVEVVGQDLLPRGHAPGGQVEVDLHGLDATSYSPCLLFLLLRLLLVQQLRVEGLENKWKLFALYM